MIKVNFEVIKETENIKIELIINDDIETEHTILDIIEENPILPDNPLTIIDKEETYCHPNNHTYFKLFLNEIILFGLTKYHPLIKDNNIDQKNEKDLDVKIELEPDDLWKKQIAAKKAKNEKGLIKINVNEKVYEFDLSNYPILEINHVIKENPKMILFEPERSGHIAVLFASSKRKRKILFRGYIKECEYKLSDRFK